VAWFKTTNVVSEVPNPEVNKDIGPTLDFIRDELMRFLRLVSEAVSPKPSHPLPMLPIQTVHGCHELPQQNHSAIRLD
jgi:hypothetical protein